MLPPRPLLAALLATAALPGSAAPAAAEAPAGDRHPGTVCVYPDEAFRHAGKGGRVLNVRMPPFNAAGDGRTDDTAALRQACDFVADKIREHGIHDGQASFIIYLPRGTYLVSDTIIHGGAVVPYHEVNPQAEGLASLRFIGESREATTVRLRDRCPGFEAGAAKPVIRFARTDFNNAETKSALRNLTINTGRGNPGAIGLDFNGANGNSVSNLAVLSGDGAGAIGLHFRVPPTQGYHCDLTVTGFDYGISSDPYHAQQNSFEYVTLRGQRRAGLRVLQSGVSIRKLRSENAVPAISQERPGSHVVLLESELVGGEPAAPAIASPEGQLFVRQVTVSGYGRTLEKNGRTLAPGRTDEYVSGPVFAAAGQRSLRSLNLPVKDVPAVPAPASASEWASVDDFGAVGDGQADDSAAIQRALNSGRSAICFPRRNYHFGQPVSVPATVRRISGLFAHFSGPDVLFRVDANSPHPLVLEDFEAMRGVVCEHRAPRTVILQNIAARTAYRNRNQEWTTIFANCVNGLGKENPFIHQEAYCRFINTERKNGPNFVAEQAVVWVFGYKVESSCENFVARRGSRLEVLGGVANQTPFSSPKGSGTYPANSSENIVLLEDSEASLILHTNGHAALGRGYATAVVDSGRDGREALPLTRLPPRPGEGVASRPVKYTYQFFLPLYVNHRQP